MGIKVVVFDMGGVLLRTVDGSPRERMARRYGISRAGLEQVVFLSDFAKIAEVGGINREQLFKRILHELGDPQSDWMAFAEEFFTGDALNQELIDYAISLKPRYRLGMLSNAFMEARDWLSNQFDFLNIFDESIFSYEIKARKPQPEVYAALCERMRTEPQHIVFIDDFFENVVAAQEFGINAVHFQNNQQIFDILIDILDKSG